MRAVGMGKSFVSSIVGISKAKNRTVMSQCHRKPFPGAVIGHRKLGTEDSDHACWG